MLHILPYGHIVILRPLSRCLPHGLFRGLVPQALQLLHFASPVSQFDTNIAIVHDLLPICTHVQSQNRITEN